MSRTIVVTSIAIMRQAVLNARTDGDIALVPTMGALHEGHLSLVRAARKKCKTIVTSIFVNPTQFGPNEDFTRYPRDVEADVRKLEQERVDLVFAPSVDEMYPNGGFGTFVEVPEISDRLDGRSRPNHFRGVATVVAKLFHIVSPDFAFFGQKDAAQVAVLRAMVRDLNFPVELVVCPTVRESDGLAMSSRNQYLDRDERSCANVLYHSLCKASEAFLRGRTNAQELRQLVANTIHESKVHLEYIEITEPDTLLPVDDVSGGALVAIAAWIGQTRLIDNILLQADGTTVCA
ncbi:MAG TPA: pantoate--beta-alanine ligase [Candidatus Aquilonibacter sp.]|nr:pantoate--beta-alanine ligase [Candidatus Aquilonibacter sp.]